MFDFLFNWMDGGSGNKYAKGGTIDTDTVIIPEMIAEDASIEEYTKKFGVPKTKEEVEKADKIIPELRTYLVKRANYHYKNNKDFKKSISNSNKGRDTLSAFMKHWSVAFLNGDKNHASEYYEVGGKVSKYSKETLANLNYQIQNADSGWIESNPDKFKKMQEEYRVMYKKIHGKECEGEGKYAKGGGVSDDRLINSLPGSWTLKYFDATDPDFDVEYTNGEYDARIVGTGVDYNLQILKGDFIEDNVNISDIGGVKRYLIDFMKSHKGQSSSEDNKEDSGLLKCFIIDSSENEFLSILDENGIMSHEFIEYEDDGGINYAVYEVPFENKSEYDIIVRNCDNVKRFARGGDIKSSRISKWMDTVINEGGSYSEYDNKKPKDWHVDDFNEWVKDYMNHRNEITDKDVLLVTGLPKDVDIVDYLNEHGSGKNNDEFYKKFDSWNGALYDIFTELKEKYGNGKDSGEKTRKYRGAPDRIGVGKANNGTKGKFTWVQEQGGVASGLFSQASFEEIFKEISEDDNFKLVIDDEGLKVFERKSDKYRVTFRLKAIFADGGMMAKGGHVSKGELVWRKLNHSERADFLYKNCTPQHTPRTQETLVGKAYNFLPKDVKVALEARYANDEDYAKGGRLDSEFSNFTGKEKIVRKLTTDQVNGIKLTFPETTYVNNPIIKVDNIEVGQNIIFNNKEYRVHSINDDGKVFLQRMTKNWGKRNLSDRGLYVSITKLVDAGTMAKGGEVEDIFHVTGKDGTGKMFIKKDFDGFTKKEIIYWWEERGYKYNSKGEKGGANVIGNYEFFVKSPYRAKNVVLPKSGKYSDGGEVETLYCIRKRIGGEDLYTEPGEYNNVLNEFEEEVVAYDFLIDDGGGVDYAINPNDEDEWIEIIKADEAYAKGGEVNNWYSGWGDKKGVRQLSFNKSDYNVNVNLSNLEVDVNINKGGNGNIDGIALSNIKAQWSQHHWGYLIKPKNEEQLIAVLKVLNVRFSEDRVKRALKEGVYAKGGRVKKKWIADAVSGKKGVLRKKAMKEGLLKGKDDKLSLTDLHKLEKMGGRTRKRAYLAETLMGFNK